MNIAKEKLIKRLKEENIDLENLWEETFALNNLLQQLELNLDFNTVTGDDPFLLVSCYSDKIEHSIVLTWNADSVYENYEQLAKTILELREQAQTLEQKITLST